MIFGNGRHGGKRLMDLHLNYESVEPFELKRIDVLNLHPGSFRGSVPSPQPSSKGRGVEVLSLWERI